MVRAKGLEPPSLAALEPKSSASTNSATPAFVIQAHGARIRAVTGDPAPDKGHRSPPDGPTGWAHILGRSGEDQFPKFIEIELKPSSPLDLPLPLHPAEVPHPFRST